jgi:hypothetical protein
MVGGNSQGVVMETKLDNEETPAGLWSLQVCLVRTWHSSSRQLGGGAGGYLFGYYNFPTKPGFGGGLICAHFSRLL